MTRKGVDTMNYDNSIQHDTTLNLVSTCLANREACGYTGNQCPRCPAEGRCEVANLYVDDQRSVLAIMHAWGGSYA